LFTGGESQTYGFMGEIIQEVLQNAEKIKN
jgi:hypothetical protein